MFEIPASYCKESDSVSWLHIIFMKCGSMKKEFQLVYDSLSL